MDAVAFPVAVGTEIDAEVGALGWSTSSGLNVPRGEGGGGRREDGGKNGECGSNDELHVENGGRSTVRDGFEVFVVVVNCEVLFGVLSR